jgi:hypothetical protein
MKPLAVASAASPPGFPTRQYISNKISHIPMSMPFKSQTMTQGSSLSNDRSAYRNNSIGEYRYDTAHNKELYGGRSRYGGSDITYMRRVRAIGKNANTIKSWVKPGAGIQPAALSSAMQDRNIKNARQRKCRSGGSVAPPKKGYQ